MLRMFSLLYGRFSGPRSSFAIDEHHEQKRKRTKAAKSRVPCQSICGRDVLYDQLALFRLAVPFAHKFAEFDRGREVIAMSILERTEGAVPLLHKSIDLLQDAFTNLIRQRHEREAANDRADPSNTGPLMN